MASNSIPHIEEGHAQAEVKRWTSRSEAKELRGIAHVRNRMRATRWDPITLVSFHPWPLHATGYVHHDLRIPPAPLPTEDTAPRITTLEGRELTYALYAFTDYKIDGIPNEAGERTFEEMLPLYQACDYIYQHNNSMRNNVGGMFCYVGVEPPQKSLEKEAYLPSQNAYTPETCQRMTVKEAIERAHADQITYYLKALDEAQDIHVDEAKAWRKGQRRSEINNTTRRIVILCRAWGVIDRDPDWYTAKRTGKQAKPPRDCPSCGVEAKPKAVRCTNGTCTYVFDAFEAFENYVIGLDTPGAALAFRRLTEAQIKHLIKAGMFTKDQLTAAGMPGFEKEEKKSKATS